MKKILVGLLACLIVLSGCSKTPESPSQTSGYTSGTYEARAVGYGGELTVEVTITDGKMSDLVLKDQNESSPVINRALPVIKERIIEAQSPLVDNVTGATFSSYAIKKAVGEIAKEAGVDFGEITMQTAPAKKDQAKLDTVNTDLLVVGGGPAGLAAAITAKQEGVENIIVVEKMDILSGNGKFDMNFYDLINSEAQKAAGNEITVEDFKESMKNAGNTPERLDVWANEEAELDAWLRAFNVTLDYNYGGTNHMHTAESYAGEHIQDGMEAEINRLGIEVRTGTKGYDLITDNSGKIIGVKVQHQNEVYEIHAKAVIIATGGYSANVELIEKYAPDYKELSTSNQMGATGDFVPVFEGLKYKLENMDMIRAFPYIISARRDLTSGGDLYLLINEKGERFVDEAATDLKLASALAAQKSYYFFDQQAYDSSYRLRKQVDLGYIVKGETLEELATTLGVDVTALRATIEDFNAFARGDKADSFREKEVKREVAAEGPYYAVQVETARHMTKGGVVCNEKAQVLTTTDEVVEGLYASGEVTWQSGGYSQSVVFGRVAAKNAANYIKGE